MKQDKINDGQNQAGKGMMGTLDEIYGKVDLRSLQDIIKGD